MFKRIFGKLFNSSSDSNLESLHQKETAHQAEVDGSGKERPSNLIASHDLAVNHEEFLRHRKQSVSSSMLRTYVDKNNKSSRISSSDHLLEHCADAESSHAPTNNVDDQAKKDDLEINGRQTNEAESALRELASAKAKLTLAAKQGSIEARLSMAQSRELGSDLLAVLANDSEADVRYAVAENVNTPESMLFVLTNDEQQYVSGRALQSWKRKSKNRIDLMNADSSSTSLFPYADIRAYSETVLSYQDPPIFGSILGDSAEAELPRTTLGAVKNTFQTSIEFEAMYGDDESVTSANRDDQFQETETHTVEWLVKVAEDPNVNLGVLVSLSFHPSAEVRIAVADNSATPTELLVKLAHDSDPDVRFAIAENHNADALIIGMLSDDENPYVAHRAHQTMARVHGGQLITRNFNSGNSLRAAQ